MKAKNSSARKGVKRRRTGCSACRASHHKCDEVRPICGRCKRLDLECEPSNFIVQSLPTDWGGVSTESTPDITIREPVPPVSTWDLFSGSIDPLPPAVHSQDSDLPSNSRQRLDSEQVTLIQGFQNGIGCWVGVFDDEFYFQRTVPRMALNSGLLLNAICALTAKQRSGTEKGQVWKAAAVHYYGDALRHLIQTLGGPGYVVEEALVGTILLSSYELNDSPGLDHRRHVCGALTLVRKYGCKASSKGLTRAAFWVYARQDVSMALAHECPTMLPPDEWEVDWGENEQSDYMLGNKIVWILANVLQYTFSDVSKSTSSSRRRNALKRELDSWFGSLPKAFCGVPYESNPKDGFSKLFFVAPSNAAATCFYYLARLLLLVKEVQLQPSSKKASQPEINEIAQAIADIGFSPLSDIALIHAVQPLFYAARHIDSFEKKARIWTLLDRIEVQSGFHTSIEVQKLRDEANIAYQQGKESI